jgi:flagellar basal body-associated protein FliL
MSQEAATEAEAPRTKRSMKGWILMAVTGLVSAGAGFAVPQMLGGSTHHAAEESGHGHDAADPKKDDKKHVRMAMACIPFGDVVANLDDNRMMRYVRAKFSLAVEEKEVEPVQRLVEENKTVLKNWLIGYLQNKQIDEVRGTEGFNRVRREIQERFNEMLFPNGEAKVKEVLFDEFNVQ